MVVWDVKTGKRVFEVGKEYDAVLAADISPDHSLVALGGPSKVVRVYNTADGVAGARDAKHTEWITAVEFSPDGVLLATGDRNNGLIVWEADTGREFQNLRGHKAAITDVSWRLDSNVLAARARTARSSSGRWRTASRSRTGTRTAAARRRSSLLADGRLVSLRARPADQAVGPQRRPVASRRALGDLATEVAITHDSGRVIAGDWLGEVRLWQAADAKPVAQLAANPPTLEMLVQSQTAALSAADEQAKKTAAELAAAEAVVAEKAKAHKAAADAAAAAKASLEGLAAEKAAFDQAQSAQAAK